MIDSLAPAKDHYQQTIYPCLLAQAGFIDAYLEGQLEPMSCLVITCWQDAESAQALESDPDLQWALQQLAVYFAAQPAEYSFWLRMPTA